MTPTRKQLVDALAERFQDDRAARVAGDSKRIRSSDRDNVHWLRSVIRRFSWPGMSLVGTEGARQAWLMALHADAYLIFQRQCLELLVEAVDAGEAEAWQVAYLTDRVLIHRGQPQRYGTQFRLEGGQWVPLRTVDPATLDERRAAVGLPPAAAAGVFSLPPRLRDDPV